MNTKKNDTVELQIEPLYLKREKAAAYLSISESAFCAAVSSGQLPKPRKILGGRVGWLVYSYPEGGEFLTGPDFGCVHHEASDPKA